MTVYLFGGEKGGSGKSTLATNFAGILSVMGEDVLLIDTDKQASAARWAERRNDNEELNNITCVRIMGKGLPKQVMELKNRYGTIVIDAGGRDSVELRGAMGVCDHLFIPMIPSQFDAETIPTMSELIEHAEMLNPSIHALVIISKASPNPVVRESEELIEVLNEFDNIELANTIVRDRKIYRDAIKTGRTVLEVDPVNQKAKLELTELIEELRNEK